MRTYEITTKDNHTSKVECDFAEETDEGIKFYKTNRVKPGRYCVGKVKRDELGDVMEIDNDR